MAGERMRQRRCLICGRLPDQKALYLRGAWICSPCEERLLRTTPEAPSYALFKSRINLLWRGKVPPSLEVNLP